MDDAGNEDAFPHGNRQPDDDYGMHERLITGINTPQFAYDLLWFVQTNGWYIVIGLIVLYFVWDRVLRDLLDNLRDKVEGWRARANYDPEEEQSRQQAKMLAQEKLQQSLDEKAKEWLIKKKEIEAKKREEKINDWDRHQQGRGYRSKLKTQKLGENSSESGKPKPNTNSNSRLFRRDYNPLTGSSSRQSYRPSRGSGSQGGG